MNVARAPSDGVGSITIGRFVVRRVISSSFRVDGRSGAGSWDSCSIGCGQTQAAGDEAGLPPSLHHDERPTHFGESTPLKPTLDAKFALPTPGEGVGRFEMDQIAVGPEPS